MIINFFRYLIIILSGLFLLSLEKTIGMPLLSSFYSLQILMKYEGYTRLIVVILLSFIVAAALNASMLLVMLAILANLVILIRLKEKTTIAQLACASLIMVTVIFQAQLELLPLSFVYFSGVWLIVLASQLRRIR